MATVSQLPAQLNYNGVAGNPLAISLNFTITSSDGSALPWSSVTGYQVEIADQFGNIINGVTPSINSPSSYKLDLRWTADQTTLISESQTPRFALSIYVGGSGPYAVAAGALVLSPPEYPYSQSIASVGPIAIYTTIGTTTVNMSLSTGIQGPQGYQGSVGAQGPTGLQGPQGYQGSQGFQGAQGYQGTQGSQGYQGTVGPQGYQGSVGAQGLQGTQGYQGSVGTQGFQGSVGTQGSQGSVGSQGPQGDIGATGISISTTAPSVTTILWADTTDPGNEAIPPGGTTGQSLVKASGTNYDTTWASTVPLPSSTFQGAHLTYNNSSWQASQDWYNVIDFGAVGDGVTDDTAAINAALASGGITFFPGGYVFLCGDINLPGGADLRGVNSYGLGSGTYPQSEFVSEIRLKNGASNLFNMQWSEVNVTSVSVASVGGSYTWTINYTGTLIAGAGDNVQAFGFTPSSFNVALTVLTNSAGVLTATASTDPTSGGTVTPSVYGTVAYGSSHVLIEDLYLNGNSSAGTTGNLVNIVDATSYNGSGSYLNMNRCLLLNSPKHGVYIGNYRNASFIKNSYVYGSASVGVVISLSATDCSIVGSSIAASQVNNIEVGASLTHIEDCDIWKGGFQAASQTYTSGNNIVVGTVNGSSTNLYPKGVMISNCGIDKAATCGISVEGNATGVMIVGCVLHNNSLSTNAQNSHIRVTGTSVGAVTVSSTMFRGDGSANSPLWCIDNQNGTLLESGNQIYTGSNTTVTAASPNITNIANASGTWTVTTNGTTSNIPYATGEKVSITGTSASVGTFNGLFTVASVAPSGSVFTIAGQSSTAAFVPGVAVASVGTVLSGTTYTWTVQTSTPHSFTAGQVINLASFAPSTFNGNFAIATVPDSSTFTITGQQNLTYVSGGTAGFGIATQGGYVSNPATVNNSQQRLGIGTTSPSRVLDVQGNAALTGKIVQIQKNNPNDTNAIVTIQNATATSSGAALGILAQGNAQNRLAMYADGSLRWGDGVNSTDTTLNRTAAGVLQATNAISASGLTGATAASRYVGATASAPPVTGSFLVGDFVIAQSGKVFVCTSAGSVGTWVPVSSGSWQTVTSTNASWPIPAGATQLEIVAVGGGGAGGGGSVTAVAASGGGGGGAGAVAHSVVSVGANTTLNVQIGAGGASVSGAGGNNGGQTSVTGTGIAVYAAGGSGGAVGTSGAQSAGGFGGRSSSTSIYANVAQGGGGPGNSNAAGTGGGGVIEFGGSGGGAGGGTVGSAATGGGAGGAGFDSSSNTTGGFAAGGTANSSGSATGVAGTSAAANTGAGGGGGGASATGGSSTAGGNGGSGKVYIRVIA